MNQATQNGPLETGTALAPAGPPSSGVQLAREGLDTKLTIQAIEEIRTFIANQLRPGTDDDHMGDYYTIPGTAKPTLLLPGAEKINLYIGCYPKPRTKVRDLGNGHEVVSVHCELISRATQKTMGFGQGECSTRESKYAFVYLPTEKRPDDLEAARLKALGLGRWRNLGTRQNPKWVWADRVDNPNIWDCHHTVRLIADKRAFVHAIRRAAALSEQFSQDFEDYVDADLMAEMKSPPKMPGMKQASEGTNGSASAQPEQKARPEERKEGTKSIEAMVEEVKDFTDRKPPFVIVKVKGGFSATCFHANQFANLKKMKGQRIGFDYTTTKRGDQTYFNLEEWWTIQE
jgi:hypothetical protein